MGARLTLILVILNIALFSTLYMLERRHSADAAYREKTRQVFGPEVADIEHLKISIAGEEKDRTFERNGEKWNIKEPIDWPANPFALHRIIQQLQLLERETSFRVSDLTKTGHDLESYGLVEPRIVLTFGRGETSYQVKVGETTDLGNRLYILDPNDEWVHVVPREFAEALSMSLSDLRSETVFHIPLHEARSLNLQTSGQTKIRLTRSGERWGFETPFHTRADNQAVDSAINRLNSLRIDSFLSPAADLAEHGLVNPTMRITLDGNARRETLLIGDAVPDDTGENSRVFAKIADNPTVFTIPAEPLHALDKAQVLLRDRKLIDVDRGTLTSINLSTPNRPDVLLQKLESQQWQVVSRFPDQSVRILPADTALVERLIDMLDQAHITRFENDAPSDADLVNHGFAEPQRTVTLTGENQRTVLIGDYVVGSQGTEVYAKLADNRFVYTVDISVLRELPVSTQYFRDRLLMRQPEGVIVSGIEIRDLETDEALFSVSLPDPETSWEDALSEEPEDERKAVLALIRDLRSLRVKRYVNDGFSTSVELDGRDVEFKYLLTADLLLPGGDAPQKSRATIYLSDRLGGQTLLAGSSDLNVVFTARQTLLDALAPLLFDRPRPEPIESAAIEEDG